MKVAVYDKNPGGGGTWQGFLCLTWKIGCFIHKLFGLLDDYYGASSWDDAFKWLETRPKPLTMVQYWGHGSPGAAWLAQIRFTEADFKRLIPSMTPSSTLWFRTCSTFQGEAGYTLSKYLCDLLQCTVAGHTKTIGFFQPGLHTRRPNEIPSWKVTEADAGNSKLVYMGLQIDSRTIFCLRASIPKGW